MPDKRQITGVTNLIRMTDTDMTKALTLGAGIGGGRVVRVGSRNSSVGQSFVPDDLQHTLAAPHTALHCQVLSC